MTILAVALAQLHCERCGKQFKGRNQGGGRVTRYCSRDCIYAPDDERFWAKVDRSGGPDACWPWLSAASPAGYGFAQFGRQSRQATHVSLILAGRPLLPGQEAMHSCDNPPCVNPRHLSGGTRHENHMDMVRKGRCRPRPHLGEHHPNHRLTETQVRDIRERRAAGEFGSALAREYGVSDALVYQISTRKAWRHVA